MHVVIRPEDIEHYQQATKGLKALTHSFGGETRSDSVANGLKAIAQYKPKLVLIHDANRPFVTNKLIDEIISKLKANPNSGVAPAIAIADTVKRISGSKAEIIDRANLYQIQTPQGFYFEQIIQYIGEQYTDESTLAEANNIPMIYIPGERQNIKITYKEDVYGS